MLNEAYDVKTRERVWTSEEIIEAVMIHSHGCHPGKVQWLHGLGVSPDLINQKIARPTKDRYRVHVTFEIPADQKQFPTEKDFFRWLAQFFPKWSENAGRSFEDSYVEEKNPVPRHTAWTTIRIEAVDDDS